MKRWAEWRTRIMLGFAQIFIDPRLSFLYLCHGVWNCLRRRLFISLEFFLLGLDFLITFSNYLVLRAGGSERELCDEPWMIFYCWNVTEAEHGSLYDRKFFSIPPEQTTRAPPSIRYFRVLRDDKWIKVWMIRRWHPTQKNSVNIKISNWFFLLFLCNRRERQGLCQRMKNDDGKRRLAVGEKPRPHLWDVSSPIHLVLLINLHWRH